MALQTSLDNASPSTSCQSCSYEITELKDTIGSMQEEMRHLRDDLALRRRETALMRDALVLCRQVIEDYQNKAKLANRPESKQPRSASLRWACFQKRNILLPLERGLPRKSDIPRYIARGALEVMLLRTANLRVSGILGVIIEANQKLGRANGANWHVAGIINGKADASAAVEAVKQAVDKYAAWVAVDDDSRLKGRAIARTHGSAARSQTDPPVEAGGAIRQRHSA